MRKCSKCGDEKPETSEYFNKIRTGKCGLRGDCKVCEAKYKKQYGISNKEAKIKYDKQHYIENKDAIIKNVNQYRLENKESITQIKKIHHQNNKEAINEKQKKYVQNNRDRVVKSKQRHYQNNKEAINKCARQYYKSHVDNFKIYSQRRRALVRKLPSTLTLKQWVQVKLHFSDKCAYCGNEKPLEQEHFCPLSLGGEYAVSNIICACRSCNSSKGAKSFPAWYPQQSFYSKEREKKIYSYLGYKKNVQQLALM